MKKILLTAAVILLMNAGDAGAQMICTVPDPDTGISICADLKEFSDDGCSTDIECLFEDDEEEDDLIADMDDMEYWAATGRIRQ